MGTFIIKLKAAIPPSHQEPNCNIIVYIVTFLFCIWAWNGCLLQWLRSWLSVTAQTPSVWLRCTKDQMHRIVGPSFRLKYTTLGFLLQAPTSFGIWAWPLLFSGTVVKSLEMRHCDVHVSLDCIVFHLLNSWHWHWKTFNDLDAIYRSRCHGHVTILPSWSTSLYEPPRTAYACCSRTMARYQCFGACSWLRRLVPYCSTTRARRLCLTASVSVCVVVDA